MFPHNLMSCSITSWNPVVGQFDVEAALAAWRGYNPELTHYLEFLQVDFRFSKSQVNAFASICYCGPHKGAPGSRIGKIFQVLAKTTASFRRFMDTC